VVLAAAAVTMLPIAGSALAAAVDEYPVWDVSGDSGTVTFNDAGFPGGAIASDSTSLTAPSGKSALLNDSTPFGKVFGSSRNHGYLTLRTASGGAPSTTTITFDSPAPADRWGFTLSDIDAEKVQVTATGGDGKALATADLGWQGAFNYCTGSPLPPACSGKNDSDLPKWDGADSTLKGNGSDTNGASGWFLPSKPVKKLTFVYTQLTGVPLGQLWIAAQPREGARDIDIVNTARPPMVPLGGTVTYKVTVTDSGTAPEPDAAFRDNLTDVLDDASSPRDVRATDGTASYDRPVLSWRGPVDPGQTRVISFSARTDDPPRSDGVLRSVVIGEGPRMTCPDGKGRGCVATVHSVVFCRAAVGGRLMVPPSAAGVASRELVGC